MFGSATVDVEGFKVIGSVIGRGEIEGGNEGMLHRDKKTLVHREDETRVLLC